MAAYPNYYAGYQPQYYQPVMQPAAAQPQMQAQQAAATAPSNNIIWTQGMDAARAYLVAAGNSVLLMDSEAERFYIKTTDGSGMPQPLRVFEYKEVTTAAKTPLSGASQPNGEFVTRKEFDALAARFDALAGAQAKEAVNNEQSPV